MIWLSCGLSTLPWAACRSSPGFLCASSFDQRVVYSNALDAALLTAFLYHPSAEASEKRARSNRMSKTASASNTLTRRSEGAASVKQGEEIHITKDAWTFGILTICDEPSMRKSSSVFSLCLPNFATLAVMGCLLCCNAVQHGHNSDALLGGGFLCPSLACVALGPCCCAEKVRLRRHLRARYGIAVIFMRTRDYESQ